MNVNNNLNGRINMLLFLIFVYNCLYDICAHKTIFITNDYYYTLKKLQK